MPVKKTLLLACAALAFSIHTSLAQTVDGKPIAEIDAEYIQLSTTGRLGKSAVSIDVDFGQLDTSLERKDTQIRDENGRPVVFNSVVDALNFMKKLSYEVEHVYVVSHNGGGLCYYLLKRNRKGTEGSKLR